MKKSMPRSFHVVRLVRSFVILSALSFLCVYRMIEAKTITAEGVGYTENSAVLSALRSAVEQGIGMRIASETIVKNFQVVSDKILSRTNGYAKGWSILSSSQEFGLVKVRISANVAMDSLEKDLIAQKLLYEMANKPRIMVLFDERVEGAESFEKTAAHTFEGTLLKYGFTVIEPEQFKATKGYAAAKGLDDEDLAAVGFKNGVDLIIRGAVNVAKATPKTIYGAQFFTVPVQLNAHIVKADNARIIASKTKRVAKNSQTEASAASFGLEIGGVALADELIGELMKFWQSEEYNENTIELSVSGFGQKELAHVESSFLSFPVARALRMRYLEGSTAVYDLEIRGTIQDVRGAVEKKAGLGCSIVSLTTGRMAIKKGAASGEIEFRHTAANIEIASFRMDDIFPARFRYYETHPIVTLQLKCGERPVSDLKVSVNVPAIMEMPAEKKISRLAASGTENVTLALILQDKKVFEAGEASETRTVYGKAIVSYSENGAVVERTLTAPVKVNEKNAMDWREPDGIAAFVTYRDPVVNDLAHAAVRALPPGRQDMREDLTNAMALFAAMRARGIAYVKDPASTPGAAVLDHVQFPWETVKSKSGDCDDLSVLYAAMLSAIGIPAAIISYPDHVLVMFNTGVYEKNRYSLSADPSLCVSHNGTLWIPVETTMLTKDFSEAWRAAASEFNAALSENQPLGIIDLDKAWKTFPAVSLPRHEAVPVPDKLGPAVAADLAKFEQRTRAGLTEEIRNIEKHVSAPKEAPGVAPKLQTRLGILKARSGDYTGAIGCFKKVLDLSPTPFAESNYACALLVSGNDTSALRRFDAVYKKDKSGRIAVNRALCLFATGTQPKDIDAFVNALKEASEMMPSSAALAQSLGLDLDDIADVKASGGHEAEKQKEINLRRLKELIRKRVLSGGRADTVAGTSSESSTGTRIGGTTTESSTGSTADRRPPMVMPFGGIRGADPAQLAKIIDLLSWFEEEK